jgi:hypothetical protein
MKPFFHREESDCSYLFDIRKPPLCNEAKLIAYDAKSLANTISHSRHLLSGYSFYSTWSQQETFGAALPTTMPNNTAPEPTDTPHTHVTFDDDTSSVTKVFNEFNFHDAMTTTLPATTMATVKDTGRYFACPTTPGIMQGHVFFDPVLMAFFQHHLPTYPIAHFWTYAEAEDCSCITFYPPPPPVHPSVSAYNMLMTHSSSPYMGGPHPTGITHLHPQPYVASAA